jgi:hypothetical protein
MRDEPVEELEMGAPQEIIIVVFGADELSMATRKHYRGGGIDLRRK